MILEAFWLGQVDYQAAWTLQQALVEARRTGAAPDRLLLLEHPPTFTIGRSGTRDHLLVSAERVAELGATVVEVDRGGDITYHGPGQLIGYPILDLTGHGRDAHRYLRQLEQALIDLLAEFGVLAGRSAGYTGVWVGEEKVAAIGVRISRWICSHGFALNVDPDLDYFSAIVPCGIRDRGVTSLRWLAGPIPAPAALAPRTAAALARVLGADLVWGQSASLPIRVPAKTLTSSTGRS